MLSLTAEYALRAAAWLSSHPEHMYTSQQIAAAAHVPAEYLAKILQSLAKAEIVHGRRGLGGGYQLARHPAAITLLNVVNAIDPVREFKECPISETDHRDELCRLHERLNAIKGMTDEVLGTCSLAQLCSHDPVAGPLCSAET